MADNTRPIAALGRRRSAIRPWLIPASLIALAVLFFWKMAFTNLILARGDTFLYFYPYWEYRAEALRAGRIPLWNPYLFMGVPFLANSQAGVLYPLNWPLAFLPVTAAVKVAIIGHVGLAAVGAYLFARRALRLPPDAAWATGAAFGLGGYMTAHVEQVNQLQGLAWLPWAFWALEGARHAPRRCLPRLAAILALQVLAGHTQSAFITLVGMGIWVIIPALPRRRRWALDRQNVRAVAALVVSAVVGALLAAVQILPSLELSQYSMRGGGLSAREAVSFSLHPLLVARAVLPGYSRALFSEYIGYVGVVGLMLVGLGLSKSGTRANIEIRAPSEDLGSPGVESTPHARLQLAVMVIVGLSFALGAYNPLYFALAHLPGFNLFRAPVRWLALAAFGLAGLVGMGLQQAARHRPTPRQLAPILVAIAGMLGYACLSAGLKVAGETGPLPAPAATDGLAWVLAGLVGVAVLREPATPRTRGRLLCTALAGELLLASASLPLNALTAPEAWYSQRPAMDQLLASPGNPPARFLSMSALQFDPGDIAELRSNWETHLSPDGVLLATVATKHKEVLSPNLPMAWSIPAVDGYDGGLLPLRDYTAFESLFVPPDRLTPDGRLREGLTDVPDGRLLNLTNTRWLITDKVGDAWLDDVFYDLGHRAELGPGQSAEVAYLPRFSANALGVVASLAGGKPFPDGTTVAEITLRFAEGDVRVFKLGAGQAGLEDQGTNHATRLWWSEPKVVTGVHVQAALPEGKVVVRGLSLIDERSGAFQSLTLSARGHFRLAHSGEVKIYDNLDVLPRAFVVGQALTVADAPAAVAALAAPEFDVRREIVITGGPRLAPSPGSQATQRAEIAEYAAERVVIHTTTDAPGYLFLSDTWFPGWLATVNGRLTPIERADLLFRAVAVPAGVSTVVLEYKPRLFYIGAGITGLTMATLALLLWKKRLYA